MHQELRRYRAALNALDNLTKLTLTFVREELHHHSKIKADDVAWNGDNDGDFDEDDIGDIANYPNGKPILNPNTGEPYPLPPTLDIMKNLALGQSIRDSITKDLTMIDWFYHGQAMDYQRAGGVFNGSYRDITNYNFGAVSAAAGYKLEDALSNAGFYNRNLGNTRPTSRLSPEGKPIGMITSYGILQDAVNNITQGWNDYFSKWK